MKSNLQSNRPRDEELGTEVAYRHSLDSVLLIALAHTAALVSGQLPLVWRRLLFALLGSSPLQWVL